MNPPNNNGSLKRDFLSLRLVLAWGQYLDRQRADHGSFPEAVPCQ